MGTLKPTRLGRVDAVLSTLSSVCGFLLCAVLSQNAFADESFPISYSGRLTQASGAPLEGTVDIEASFWNDASDGTRLGGYTKTGVTLANGVFSLQIPLSGGEVAAIFRDGSSPVYIEVNAGGKKYPRQLYMFTPLALRIPVDEKHLVYDDTTGKLRLKMDQSATDGSVLTSDGRGGLTWKKIEAAQISAKDASGAAPSTNQVLTYDGTRWVAAPIERASNVLTGVTGVAPITVTGSGTLPSIAMAQASGTTAGYLGTADWAYFNTKQNALGFTPVNKAGDTLGGALNMNGKALTGLAAPLNPTDAVTKGHLDSLVLRKDGSSQLSAAWNVGAQDILNTGNLVMAQSSVLGLSNNSADPQLSGTTDKGKLWFNSATNEIKYFDGTAVRTLGVAGAGLQSLVAGSGMAVSNNGTTATIGLGAAGTAGTYVKVTTDAYGRVTTGTTLSSVDLPPLPSGLISGQVDVARGGTGVATLPANSLLLGDGTNPVQAVAPGTVGEVLTSNGTRWASAALPPTNWGSPGSIGASAPNAGAFTTVTATGNIGVGSTQPGAKLDVVGQVKIQGGSPGAGKVLTSDASGLASWATPAVGGVISVSTGVGLSGGPIAVSGTINLADTSVTPGTYTRATVTVDQQGRITSAASGSAIMDADIDSSANIAQTKISGLSSSLNARELTITGGTTSQYWRGDKSWQTLNTSAVPEGSNQYFTPARAISSISGSGPITYSTVTGTIGISQASGSGNGYLSSSDWTTFNAKQNALGYTPMNKAGDTMSGALDLASNDVISAGNVQIAAAKTLGLGVYVSDPIGLNAGDKGKTWFNSTASQIKYWDGITIQTVGAVGAAVSSLNGQSGSSQSLGTPGTTGTAPAWTSSSNVHTLNIPMASAASVTAGLISNADYGAFSAKQPAGNYLTSLTGDITTSGFSSGSATATLPNVVTAGTSTKVTYDAKGRVTAGTSLNSSDIPPLSASIISSGNLPIAFGGTGAASLTANAVVIGNGTGALQTVAPGASGNVLTSNGTTWSSAVVPATNWASPGAIGTTTPNSAAFTTLTASGSVGIGTTSPVETLQVQRGWIYTPYSASVTDGYKLGLGNTTGYMWRNYAAGYSHQSGPVSDALIFSNNWYIDDNETDIIPSTTNPTSAILLNKNGLYVSTGSINAVPTPKLTLVGSSGNVGIGTTAPTQTLHLSSAAGPSALIDATPGSGQAGLKLIAGSGSTNRATRIDFLNAVSSTTVPRWTILNDYNQNGTNDLGIADSSSVPVVTIRQGGNVGIGMRPPGTALDVNGPLRAQDNGTWPSTGVGMEMTYRAGTGYLQAYNRTGSSWLPIQINGSTVSVTNMSDGRTKSNIEDLRSEFGLSGILKLRPVNYTWRDFERDRSQGLQVGLIAQDVQRVFPKLVTQFGTNDTITYVDGDRETVSNVLGLNYNGLIVPLVKSVQEIKAEKDAEIAALKAESQAKDEAIRKLQAESAQLTAFLCSQFPTAPMCRQ